MPSNTPTQPLDNRFPNKLLIGFGVALLLVLTAITGLQQDQDPKTEPSDRGLVSSLQPSSKATAITWQVFSDLGELDYQVSAAQLEQYPSQKLMKVVSPIVQMTSQDRPPWVISADRGEITRLPDGQNTDTQSDQMTLQGHVEILRQGPGAQTELRLSTAQLHIFPATQRAQTDTPVLLQHERFTTSSEGLDLNLETGAVVFAQNNGARVISKLILRD